MKNWIVRQADEKLAGEFKLKCDLSMLVLEVLTSRGFCEFEQVVDFFSQGELEDPFLIEDMKSAVDVINSYIDEFRLICVYGDYDCDGITATALLYSYLQSMGANVIYYINEREAGYGMTLDAIDDLHKKGVELVVTVDNGISCVDEAKRISEYGMKLVITDHHQPPEDLPEAAAIINPHKQTCPSTFKDLAGVGVALKLCAALDDGIFDAVIEQYSDICAIGTVGDLVPLCGENRLIVKQGLMYLKNSESYGLNRLIDTAQVKRDKLTAGTLAFQICPRINAAGRMDSPTLALNTLLTEDEDEAQSLADKLDELNKSRKSIENEIFDMIKIYIDNHAEVLDKRVMVLVGENWHHGVIGIVSSKVLEAYGKPNIIISIDKDGNARGSARSLKGFNIHSCLTYASAFLDKFGGHECAGGLSLKSENIEAFTNKVLEYANKVPQMPAPTTECDMILPSSQLTVENISTLETLAPFGVGNAQPVFYLPNCRVKGIYPLSEGKHTKIMISYEGVNIYALIFSKSPNEMFFDIGSDVDIAANIDINEYNGKKSVSVKVKDIKPAGMNTNKYFAAKDCWERFINNVAVPKSFLRKILPTRNELVNVYKLIGRLGEIDIDTLFMRINNPVMNYCKLRVCLEAFCEAGLAQLEAGDQKIKLLPARSRANLEETDIIKKLINMVNR
ncbi:MAG: single-stranded-DNA-specific exonuclease RecJ [Ruminococcus sp.]|nr:single-stranded-DNA-specific exonuclease RecJ [Ruminococcus sp.]